MAKAVPPETTLSEELTCSVCYELLTNPVMLACMHHFCRECITCYWTVSNNEPTCPHCRMKIPDKSVKSNQLLNKVVDLVKKCSTSEYHNKIESDLKELLKTREHEVGTLNEKRTDAEKKIQSVKESGHDIRLKIAAEFQTLHEVLLKEEKQLLSSVDEEEEKALVRLRDIIKKLDKQIASLAENISFIQKTLKKSGDSFVLEAEAMMRRPPVRLESPVLDNCDLFYKHKGPFQYMVWRRMFKSIHPVPDPMTYDTSSAHTSLIFSNDLRSVTDGNRSPRSHVGDSSQRFLQCINVLGSRVYHSGKHYWEIWVGKKTKWDLGVASYSVDRKVRVKLRPKNGYWTIRMLGNNKYVAATEPWTALEIETPPKRIGVYLDCGDEELMFFDAERMVHLFTFTGIEAKGFFPFFSPGFHEDQNSEPLKICHLVL
ncbi:nuclear factor 7, brain-like [Pelobates cultripes]|uniref:Nuclear factor 7, brain-like n=1 Tax=Pelobates cultripes TaxID=61616 RepID=A0AAD1RQP6_PELCU|nr:nuclear factor 7, brain-like [Pelobates cultripes]CAH2275990.1 nuclear factor 7, brain-like [Pelobates cultripes]